jgi:hypothetical protein
MTDEVRDQQDELQAEALRRGQHRLCDQRCFIAAAIAEGFTVRRTGPNAWFNISAEARRIVARARDDKGDTKGVCDE